MTSDYDGQYPENGYSGSYWYVYEGADCIDPIEVSYATDFKGGDSLAIYVTPGTNVYGGTISYQYQYSIDGGVTWNTIGTSTATTYTRVVPNDAPQFQARVIASDDMGFTSTTYVAGPNVVLKKTSGYTSVSGAIKEVDVVVCVGGSIKTNVTVCKCVDGVVKIN